MKVKVKIRPRKGPDVYDLFAALLRTAMEHTNEDQTYCVNLSTQGHYTVLLMDPHLPENSRYITSPAEITPENIGASIDKILELDGWFKPEVVANAEKA